MVFSTKSTNAPPRPSYYCGELLSREMRVPYALSLSASSRTRVGHQTLLATTPSRRLIKGRSHAKYTVRSWSWGAPLPNPNPSRNRGPPFYEPPSGRRLGAKRLLPVLYNARMTHESPSSNKATANHNSWSETHFSSHSSEEYVHLLAAAVSWRTNVNSRDTIAKSPPTDAHPTTK